MDDTPQQRYSETFMDLVERTANLDIASESATTAVKNLETLSKIRLPLPEPEPTPEVVATTFVEKLKLGVAKVWESETTRVFIKAGGAFAGVALVVYTTIHKDHVVERQAMSQANQRNS